MPDNPLPYYMKVPSMVYNAKDAEMTGRRNWIKTYHMVNPYFIISYFPYGYKENPDDENEKMGCWVDMGGHGIQSPLTVKEIDKLIEENRKLYV